jgi:hypothetical protein
MRCPLALALLLAGCAAVPPDSVPLTGDWGGPHIQLHLTSGGGTLAYDCAHGTIRPVVVGRGGWFAADGTHTPEHGGPVREGEVLPTYPAHYSGNMRGDRMTLQARIESGAQLGPFKLRRGVQPMLTRCL